MRSKGQQAAKMASAILEQEDEQRPLLEALDGPTLGMLRKYHLVDETGEIRMVTLETDSNPAPIVDQDVIERLIALDPSSSKKILDWVLYAAGGGEPKQKESARALELAKSWVIQNRMKGQGRDEQPIKPMTRQEAEADWEASDYPRYYEAYYYADQDLASDVQYPVFGYFRSWPGRDNVYAKVVEAVRKWQAIIANKKLVSEFNKISPKEPFQTSLWDMGKPRYKTAEELLTVVNNFKATFAKRKAEKDIQFIGRAQTPPDAEGAVGPRAASPYTRGPNEVLYKDEYMVVYIPATAAASMKAGAPNWCVANRTRFDSYFRSQSQDELYWGTYNARGPFAYWHFKQTADPHLHKLAGHIQLSCQRGGGSFVNGIEFWDEENQAKTSYEAIVTRLRRALPNALPGFAQSIKEVEAWFQQYKGDKDIQRYPSLEDMARKLVNSLLS